MGSNFISINNTPTMSTFWIVITVTLAFVNGFATRDMIEDRRFSANKFNVILGLLIMVTLGGPIYGIVFLVMWVKNRIKAFGDYFQIRTFFGLAFTKRFDKITKDKLYQFNEIAKAHFNTKSVRDQLYREALTQINDRNEYNHEEYSVYKKQWNELVDEYEIEEDQADLIMGSPDKEMLIQSIKDRANIKVVDEEETKSEYELSDEQIDRQFEAHKNAARE